MKKLLPLVLAAVIILPGAVAINLGSSSSDDIREVRETIGHYFAGHETGDGSHFTQAFHEDAKLFWIRDGELNQRTSTEFAAGARGEPADDEDQRKRRIVNIDISGNAAVVKVELDYPGVLIHDYMSMLKTEDGWKIVNKTFVVHSKD